VLDPSPVVALDSDLAAADAAIGASRAEFDRMQKLLAAGDNASRKSSETAEAQFRSDEIKAESLRRQAALKWGDALPIRDAGKRRAFVEGLVMGESALVRVDLLPGDAITEVPRAAHLLVLGREQQPVESTRIVPSADADARTQAQGYLIIVEKPSFPLRPGMALTGWLELPQKPRAGFLLPSSAVLRHDGRTWVFAHEEKEKPHKEKDEKDDDAAKKKTADKEEKPDAKEEVVKFVRKAVVLDSPLANGWFVDAESGGLEGDEHVVARGAQVLLSEEMKASGGHAEEE
jgi:hypothetical protein